MLLSLKFIKSIILGSEKMKLIIGLGNPGRKYDNTRHNIGFLAVDYYISRKKLNGNWQKKFNGLYLQCNIDSEKVIFLKPQTYMNLSGEAVSAFVNFFKIDISDILVISDDLDLSIGNFKLKANGSSGGHNGLKSIEQCLGNNEYKRLKIGISKDKNIDTKDYVLGSISSADMEVYHQLFHYLVNVIDDFFKLPFQDLMSRYNQKNR